MQFNDILHNINVKIPCQYFALQTTSNVVLFSTHKVINDDINNIISDIEQFCQTAGLLFMQKD